MLRKNDDWFAKVLGDRPAPAPTAGDPRVVRRCERCKKPLAAIHVTRMEQGKVASEAHLCQECAEKSLWFPAPKAARLPTDLADANREVPVEVEAVMISEVSDGQL